MHVPLPPGYLDSYGVCDYETNNNQGAKYEYVDEDGNTVDGATAIQQARRWRQHTNKYHHIEIVEVKGDDDDDFSSKIQPYGKQNLKRMLVWIFTTRPPMLFR